MPGKRLCHWRRGKDQLVCGTSLTTKKDGTASTMRTKISPSISSIRDCQGHASLGERKENRGWLLWGTVSLGWGVWVLPGGKKVLTLTVSVQLESEKIGELAGHQPVFPPGSARMNSHGCVNDEVCELAPRVLDTTDEKDRVKRWAGNGGVQGVGGSRGKNSDGKNATTGWDETRDGGNWGAYREKRDDRGGGVGPSKGAATAGVVII